MTHISSEVISTVRVGPNIFVQRYHSPEIASSVLPGQFINIRVYDGYQPLLRRPFSIYRVDGDFIEIIFGVVGVGTSVLSQKEPGVSVDVIGPLGRSFDVDSMYGTAILVGGGLGVAPLPFLTDFIKGKKHIVTFLGARSKEYLIKDHLLNVYPATDDGSEGFGGSVVEALRSKLEEQIYPAPKIFACGPNPMLAAVSKLAIEFDISCEISVEGSMACGIGICQGCPIENTAPGKKYSLICKEGPVFESNAVVLS